MVVGRSGHRVAHPEGGTRQDRTRGGGLDACRGGGGPARGDGAGRAGRDGDGQRRRAGATRGPRRRDGASPAAGPSPARRSACRAPAAGVDLFRVMSRGRRRSGRSDPRLIAPGSTHGPVQALPAARHGALRKHPERIRPRSGGAPRLPAGGRRETSPSRELSARLADGMSSTGEVDRVIDRDLLAGVGLITPDWVATNFTPAEQRSPAQHEVLVGSDALVDELVASDVVVITAPIYNFAALAKLKARIDRRHVRALRGALPLLDHRRRLGGPAPPATRASPPSQPGPRSGTGSSTSCSARSPGTDAARCAATTPRW